MCQITRAGRVSWTPHGFRNARKHVHMYTSLFHFYIRANIETLRALSLSLSLSLSRNKTHTLTHRYAHCIAQDQCEHAIALDNVTTRAIRLNDLPEIMFSFFGIWCGAASSGNALGLSRIDHVQGLHLLYACNSQSFQCSNELQDIKPSGFPISHFPGQRSGLNTALI